MNECRFPGCRKRVTVQVSDAEWWCDTHARGEADRALRQYVMERDGRVCQRCGGGAHDAMHLIPRGRAPFLHWQPENVVAGCRPCHQALDGSPASREIWTEARWPGRLEWLQTRQLLAERYAVRVDVGAAIRELREGPPVLRPVDVAAYGEGRW